MFHDNDEDLVENVVSLRNQLRRTEFNLQSLGNQLCDCNAEHSYRGGHLGLPNALAAEDPLRFNVTETAPDDSPDRTAIMMAERRSCGSAVQAESRATVNKEIESENSQLKRRLDTIREENSSLMLENRQLIKEIEALQIELASSKTKICLLGSSVGSKTSSASLLKGQVLGLEADLEEYATALRDAEKRLEESRQLASLSSRQVNKLKEELRSVKAELAHRSAQGHRAEQQRNEALYNAEKLTVAFKEYKVNAEEKLKKVLEDENKLKETLIQCDKERGELESRCDELEQENTELSQTVRRLKEELEKAQAVSTEVVDMRTQLEEAWHRASAFECELAERNKAAAVEVEALRQENDVLNSVRAQQEEVLAQCRQEAEKSRAELRGLEAILTMLHLQEEGGALCVKPCMLPSCSTLSRPGNLLSFKPGEGYERLLKGLQALEQEKNQQANLTSGLQVKLAKAQEEISALQDSMAQRASHFQRLHSELLEKASEAGRLEKEMKKKNSRLATLEKQLQEKTSAYSQAVVKNCELEQNLLERSSSVEHLQSLLRKKEGEVQQAVHRSKQAATQQQKQLEHQVELLQLSLDQRQALTLELEQTVAEARQGQREALQKAEQLHLSLNQLAQEKETVVKQSEEALQNFKEQASQYCDKVKNLEKSLALCKDELNIYLQQMEDAKEQFESQLEMKSAEVGVLQEELRSSALAYQDFSEHNVQLQRSLQQQQVMLQNSVSRVAELEECQAQLERQVAKLEQELETKEHIAQEAAQEAQRKEQQAADLSSSVSQLTAEMEKCRGELTELEVELLQLRRDSGLKALQISQMAETLQETQGLLEKKTDLVVDLEEKLHRSEMDRRNSLQRAQLLETQLQTVRGELADTLGHLQELRDVLQRTQLNAEEREAAMDRLAAELRESQRELEERNHEILNMDTVLKERQGELQQRAMQLNQLDVAIRDHKLELEKKILHLQGALEKSERELKERDNQVEDLGKQLELVRKQLLEKEVLEKKVRDEGQQLQRTALELQRTARELQESTRLVGEKSGQDVQNQQLWRELAMLQAQKAEGEVCLRATIACLEKKLEALQSQKAEGEATIAHLEKELEALQSQKAEGEAHMLATIAHLEKELEVLKDEHHRELSAMQQSHSQLLRVSDHISSSLRSSQEQLTQRLQQVTTRLQEEQSITAALQAELHAREDLLRDTRENQLIKESEVTRLQAKVSSYERMAELQNASLRHESALGFSSPPCGSKGIPPTVSSAGSDLDSLDLPESLKEALRDPLQPLDHSWQGLSQPNASCSELSFNPLTYMADEEAALSDFSGCTPQDEPNMNTLTGMLHFITRRLASQEEPGTVKACTASDLDATMGQQVEQTSH